MSDNSYMLLVQKMMNFRDALSNRQTQLEDRILNLESYKDSMQKSLDDFVKDCDVSDKQWIEERLRALELQVKDIREILIDYLQSQNKKVVVPEEEHE